MSSKMLLAGGLAGALLALPQTGNATILLTTRDIANHTGRIEITKRSVESTVYLAVGDHDYGTTMSSWPEANVYELGTVPAGDFVLNATLPTVYGDTCTTGRFFAVTNAVQSEYSYLQDTAATYYLIASDSTTGTSSLAGSSGGGGWTLTKGSSTKNHAICKSGGDYINDGLMNRTPDADAAYTVLGNSFTMLNGASLAMKTGAGYKFTIPNLISYNGSFNASDAVTDSAGYQEWLSGHLYIPEDGQFTCAIGASTDQRGLALNSTVTGSGTLYVKCTHAQSNPTSYTMFKFNGDMSEFEGPIVATEKSTRIEFDTLTAWPKDLATYTADSIVITNGTVMQFAVSGEFATPNRGITVGDVTQGGFSATDADIRAGLQSPISGSAGFKKNGYGELVLEGASPNLSGPITINYGTLSLSNATAVGSAAITCSTTYSTTLKLYCDAASDGFTMGAFPTGNAVVEAVLDFVPTGVTEVALMRVVGDDDATFTGFSSLTIKDANGVAAGYETEVRTDGEDTVLYATVIPSSTGVRTTVTAYNADSREVTLKIPPSFSPTLVYCAVGDWDYGTQLRLWPEESTYLLGSVPARQGTATFTLPAAAVQSGAVMRFIVMSTETLPVDAIYDYVQAQRAAAATGSYVMTGITPNQDTLIELDFMMTSVSSNQCFFCSRSTNSGGKDYLTSFFIYSSASSYGIRYDYYNTMPSANTNYKPVIGTRYLLETLGGYAYLHPYANPTNRLAAYGTYVNPCTFTSKQTMLFMSGNASTSPNDNASTWKLYGFKMRDGEDGDFLCNFVPAATNGVVGLYDTVRKVFKSSGNTTYPLLAGNKISDNVYTNEYSYSDLMLNNGYLYAEEWTRTCYSPCAGGSSVRRMTESGDYVHIFNDTNGVFRAPADSGVTIHYVVVGGGGGGGGVAGGGGGGGGVQYGTMTLAANETVQISVGQGGVGYNNTTYSKYYEYWKRIATSQTASAASTTGANFCGKASSIVSDSETVTAPGGGGGGSWGGAGTVVSGAGKGAHGTQGTYTQGGNAKWSVGTIGIAGHHAGNGADGVMTCIAGEAHYFGGGGGGSLRTGGANINGGSGGLGGGGAGSGKALARRGYDADVNTGSGGGGGLHNGNYYAGGCGARGTVIIRYAATGLTATDNGCIDHTHADGEQVTIGEYTATDGTTGTKVLMAPARGGDEIRLLSNGEYVHRFTQNGMLIAPDSVDLTVQYLVIGGGGAGGAGIASTYYGGGGGAGAVLYGTLTIPAGKRATVVVGAGGAASAAYGSDGTESTLTVEGSTLTAPGGGGGGYMNGITGRSGGSAGGSNALPNDFDRGTFSGYGISDAGGGGGGAGFSGGDYYSNNSQNHGGDGGDGVYCAITGVNTAYAGGGGGGSRYWGGAGGVGGGGNGACYTALSKGYPATTPTANTGSGGGGGNVYTYAETYGSGGADGVVILRYSTTAEPVECGEEFDIDEGIDVADPLANCRGALATVRGYGGTWERLANGDFLHKFEVGSTKFQSPAGVTSSLRYLVVGGGGPGGIYYGGGGGGGGGVRAGYFAGGNGEQFNITVGDGKLSSSKTFYNGEDSFISNAVVNLLAKGGGYGGAWGDGYPTAGNAGGSGGGAGSSSNVGGAGLTGAKHSGGGNNGITGAAGGGGGACADGGSADSTAKRCGDGGDGYNSTITGVADLYYGGGGGGYLHGSKSAKSYAQGYGGKGSVQVPNADGTYYGGGSPGAKDTDAGTKSGPGVVYIRYSSNIPTTGEGSIAIGATGDDRDASLCTFEKIAHQYFDSTTQSIDNGVITPAFTPSIGTVRDVFGDELTEGTDYTLSYSFNNCAGTATVTVTGISSRMTGSTDLHFKISVTHGLLIYYF